MVEAKGVHNLGVIFAMFSENLHPELIKGLDGDYVFLGVLKPILPMQNCTTLGIFSFTHRKYILRASIICYF